MNGIKFLLRKIIFKEKASSETFIAFLKKKGASIGDDVYIFRPANTNIDLMNPYLLSIGNHVMMTGPVTILTHDYSWCVLKYKYGNIVGNQKAVHIGDNVFIGWGATILAGTQIGENVIIGANSVVSGEVQSNSVYAGNPARKIMSLEEYYIKRKNKQLDEAVDVVRRYKEVTGNFPNEEVLYEYFYLFFDANNKQLKINKKFERQLKLMENYEQSISYAKKNEPVFHTYDEFINYCKKHIS